jgi:hypothetical protein
MDYTYIVIAWSTSKHFAKLQTVSEGFEVETKRTVGSSFSVWQTTLLSELPLQYSLSGIIDICEQDHNDFPWRISRWYACLMP